MRKCEAAGVCTERTDAPSARVYPLPTCVELHVTRRPVYAAALRREYALAPHHQLRARQCIDSTRALSAHCVRVSTHAAAPWPPRRMQP